MLPATRAERARLAIAVCALGILVGMWHWLFTSGHLQIW